MNILLLAMSTYPSNMRHCIASYGEDREEYSYFSQLEPGCKHFIKKLGASGKNFDKIITLCTEETLTAPKDTFDKDGKPKHQFLKCGDENEEISELSPYEFFRKRMLGYIRNDDEAFAYEKKLGADVSGYNAFSHSELYPQPEELFIKVKINRDEIDITSTIKEVINIIDDLPGKKGKPICLYLNAQGGARKNVQIVNTVLNMLQSRKYTLSEVSVIEYNDDRDATRFRMLDATSSYLINDMAAAMNAFLQYGRADMFVEYYKRYKKIHNIDEAPEDIVVEAINKISDAILLSDTEGFLECIGGLKDAIKSYDSISSGDKDPFFELIENDIKASYKELFDSSDIIADLDLLIKWCLDRNLLQQAVTILEAKTPFFVFRYGFIYGNQDEETRQALIELRSRGRIPDYKFEHPEYLLVNTFCMMSTEKTQQKNKPFRAALDFAKNREKLQQLAENNYQFDLANFNGSSRNTPVIVNICSDWYFKNEQIYPNDPEGIDKATNDMIRFVVNYRNICEFRNNTNHSNVKLVFKDLKGKAIALSSDLKRIKSLASRLEPQKREFFKNSDIPKRPQNRT